MLVSTKVLINVGNNNSKYWKNLGYVFDVPKVRGGLTLLEVDVYDLQPKSNVCVECWCEKCETFFSNRWSRYNQYCDGCLLKSRMFGNTLAHAHRGKTVLSIRGENHPRWNPNKTAFKQYANKVRMLSEQTYNEHKLTLNPNNYPRTLCGVDGGYQLDHKVSIKNGFKSGIQATELASIENLQLLPWKLNRDKWDN